MVRFLLVVLATIPHFSAGAAYGESADVQARVELERPVDQRHASSHDASDVVVWLNALSPATRAAFEAAQPGRYRMEQKNKSFHPHLLVVPLGSTVEFPNLDPFFHNVFSQFNGKRFDLGLYEAGSSRAVRFDHEGISYLFCNIHSKMAAVVVTLVTPYFAVSTESGAIEIRNVPEGEYEMHVWAEGADPKQLEALTRPVRVGEPRTDLGAIKVKVAGALPAHKNKFGEDYKPEQGPSY